MPYKDPQRQKEWLANRDRNRPPEHWARQNKRYRERIKDYLTERKNVPCQDCGGHFPSFVMDFDHVRGEKNAGIARLVSKRCSIERIEEEIAKCEIVCANCHRIRTFTRAKQ